MIFAYVLLGIAAVITVLGIISIIVDGEGLFVLFVAVIVAALGSNALSDAKAADVPHLSATQACTQASVRPMPVPATLRTTQDNRVGEIYPCNLLQDMGFAPNKPTALLGGINEAVFTDSSFQATSSWGGILFFGLGGAGGSSSSQSSTARRDMYAFMARATNGAYTKFVVDSDSVQLATCRKCEPYATLQVDDNPIFVKKRDGNQNDSIWLKFPGGLSSPGKMLQSMARVVITLPSSLLPKALE